MLRSLKIFIDDEPYEPPQKTMTANEILMLAKLPPDQYYLVKIKRHDQISFKGKGNEEIDLYEGDRFIGVRTGPTPVSDTEMECAATKQIGAPLFAAELRRAGYEVVELRDHHLKFPYVVNVGKLAGMRVELGFVVPQDFPMTPPSGPHINKLLHPNCSGGEHPTGGIHSSSKHSEHFSSGWQYWSRPYKDWATSKRNVACYMAFIHQLWASQ